MTAAPDILNMGAKALSDRASTRDCPEGERSMRRAVDAFNALVGGDKRLTETEGWLFMAVLKAARATAGGHNLDDYVDGAAYFALAGESADRGVPQAPSPPAQQELLNTGPPGAFIEVPACCKYPNPNPSCEYCINCGKNYSLPEE